MGPGGGRRVLAWLVGFLGLVLGLLAAGVIAAVTSEEEKAYPKAWDGRVLPLVLFVEQQRGWSFEHPVEVEFLTAAEYRERTRADEESFDKGELEDLRQAEALLRAFGLITSDVDLLETLNDLNDTGTLAYYDREEERVTVRGTDVTPELRVTLVHELTHALQEQTFGNERFDEDDDELTSGQMMAYRALMEGDADRIEQAYLDSLSAEEKEAAEEGTEDEEAAFEEQGAPPALRALSGMPYALGGTFVELLTTVAPAKLDEAFMVPPESEEQVLDPFAYLDDDKPRAVPTPPIEGLEVEDEGDFGAASLLIVLAERIDLRQALRAALGWGGDAYAAFHRDGRTCARVDVAGDTPADTEELEGALRVWAAASPEGTATVTRKADLVELESCDPGSGATASSGGSLEALGLARARTEIAVHALGTGAQPSAARCYATAVTNELDFDETSFERAFESVVELAARCRQ